MKWEFCKSTCFSCDPLSVGRRRRRKRSGTLQCAAVPNPVDLNWFGKGLGSREVFVHPCAKPGRVGPLLFLFVLRFPAEAPGVRDGVEATGCRFLSAWPKGLDPVTSGSLDVGSRELTATSAVPKPSIEHSSCV